MLKKRHIVLAMSAAVLSSSAMAGLTISPAIRGTVEVSQPMSQPGPKVQVQQRQDSSPKSIKGSSTVHGSFKLSESDKGESKVFRYGENAPLFLALEKVVPNSDDWDIKVEKGLENHPVSWSGGDTWEGVVNAIADQNSLGIVVNHAEKVIGVAREGKVADAMASQSQRVFRLDGSKSLRENLDSWAKQAGYKKVIFTREIRNLEYPVIDAVFLGELNSHGGAMHKLLAALNEDAQTPLKAEFREGNGVILIKKRTSTKEMY